MKMSQFASTRYTAAVTRVVNVTVLLGFSWNVHAQQVTVLPFIAVKPGCRGRRRLGGCVE